MEPSDQLRRPRAKSGHPKYGDWERNLTTVSAESFPRPIGTAQRFAGLLAATALGVYLLVIVGATTSMTDAAAACTTWPTCATPTDPLSQTELAIAWGHRIAAVIVAGLVLVTTAVAWLGDATRRVRYVLIAATVLYAVQVAVGAATATIGPDAMVPGLHLGLGVTVFAVVVLALAWHLEVATGTEDASEGTSARTDVSRQDAGPDGVVDVSDSGVAGVAETGVAETGVTAASDSGVADADVPIGDSRTAARHSGGVRQTIAAYVSMTKPRLMWLLCLVAAAGMALAVGPDLGAETVVATLTGGVLAIGASGTFNHVLERDVDRRMNRTADRPLATDLVPVGHALAFGFVLGVASIAVFATINALAAALGLIAIVFYSVVYTLLLKPNTVQNTVIGGAAGALPALIGWAAATNEIGLPALALAGVIFLWTPAHFYNLALAYREDYERGGFPMLSVVRGETVTRKHILYYLGATLAGAAGLAWISGLGILFAATVVVFGAIFLWTAVTLHFEQTERAAFRSFHASNAFLGALLVVIVIEALVVVG